MMAKKAAPETHAEYIAQFPLPVRTHLKELRALIRKLAPQAKERISYGIAAFEWNGPLVYIAGFKNHVSFFPTSSGVSPFKSELKGFKTSRGTIQFPLDQPLPLRLISQIVHYRMKELRHPRTGRGLCDADAVKKFDTSGLSEEFSVLAKPAQRALVNAGVLTVVALSKKSEAEVRAFHGMGPKAVVELKLILKSHGRKFPKPNPA